VKSIDRSISRFWRPRYRPNYTHLPDALRAAFLLASARDRWDEAEQFVREALDVTETMGNPYARARMLYEYGRELVRRGKSDAGRTHLHDALTIFEDLGSMHYVGVTREALSHSTRD
jgi:hypothetical protein